MKAKEAPEKIYVPTTGNELHYHMACPNNEFQESIEYIRTDAFIEKACEFIETYPHLFMGVLRSEVIEDFKNYMKGG